eukprot:24712_1
MLLCQMKRAFLLVLFSSVTGTNATMAADNNLLQQQYNVMSQFADLSELESSDEDGSNPFTHPPKQNITIEENPSQPKDIIHPTIPQNNNSQFDLTQFQDLSLLESSEDEAPPKQPEPQPKTIPAATNKASKAPRPQSSSTKPNHSKAAQRTIDSKPHIYKKRSIKRNMATSIVQAAIDVTNKINATQSKKKPNASQHQNGKNTETEEKEEVDLRVPFDKKRAAQTVIPAKKRTMHRICPFRKVLMFAMHLHLTGTSLPKWMVNVLTLFNDSDLKSCHEAASLGKSQRKLFVDTVCHFSEPDNFIYVNTMDSIEIGDGKKKVKYASWAVVNVAKDNAKYSELESINGHTLCTKITNNHLMINKGVYLFFNDDYKTQYLDVFLYSKDKESILYCCDEYKAQQRAHIKKILALDYEVDNKYSEWFLGVYDTWLGHYDVNDCYELLAGYVKYWKDLILNKVAVSIQFTADRTFVVKTMHSKQWVDDRERDHCSYSDCSERFGVVTRKHHCRCCGDIFCKDHCIKARYRRNEYLESLTRNMYVNDSGQFVVDPDMGWNEREIRVCPECKNKYALFVDVPHKHQFMNCQCLKWNLNQIDFEKEWLIFKSKVDGRSHEM